MFLTRSEYDRSVNTFSPEGRLFQVEYAIEAIKLGSTAIGIRTDEGVVLAVEKRLTSSLMEPTTIEKIVEIDGHLAAAFSGLTADSKILIEKVRNFEIEKLLKMNLISDLFSLFVLLKARVEAQNFWFSHDSPIRVESVAQSVSNLAIQFGDSDDSGEGALSRPFGVALLFAGNDPAEGPQLYHMDPSGTYVQFDAKAIGSGSEGAQQSLQEVYHKGMTLKESIKSAMTILKQVMEEKLNDTNVQVATVTKDQGFKLLSGQELQNYIQDLS